MKRILGIGLLLMVLPFWCQANNVRLSKPLTIEEPQNWNAPTVAELKLQISWDNAWRDGSNWDAVYLFLKWKRKYETEWKHVLLMDATHQLTAGFTYWSRNYFGNTNNASHGIFIHFDHKESGNPATVDLNVKWNLPMNGVTQGEFYSNDIEVSAHCIEMVYVPKGPFSLGDFVSNKSLKKEWRTILPQWDEIKKDAGCIFTGSGASSGSAENAADHVNETRANDGTHVWSSQGAINSWTVEFPQKKKILWIAVSAGYNCTTYRPNGNWLVEASNDKLIWKTVGNFSSTDWLVDRNSYPVPRALKLNETPNLDAYKFYRIIVKDLASKTIWAANISMTTVDLDKVADDGFMVDNWYSRGTRPYFDYGAWISSSDGDTWNGELCGVNYPSGYEGFYAMKYEMTQEQWIGFLNKLSYNQQKARTIGNTLDQLKEKEYVYGAKRNQPNCRNGIILAERKDYRCLFAANLNNTDALYNQKDDGQNIACNYLSPADMLAYADWTGLRPLSEMEYEKMGRDLAPAVSQINEYVWGGNSYCNIPSSGSFAAGSAGLENEKLSNANVNANNILSGPVRSGSFAKGAASRQESGAGFWGNMELGGNLGEIYYNLNSAGRAFHGSRDQHGNGGIDGNGNTDMNIAYWPQDLAAFIVRGGGFTTTDKKKLAISDRSYGVTFANSVATPYIKDINRKDSTLTFRLGHSYSQLEGTSELDTLILANGVFSMSNGASCDTVCAGSSYTITGTEVSEKQKEDGDIRYYWYASEDETVSWRLVPNSNTKDLEYTDLQNRSWNNSFRQIYFRRYAVSPRMLSYTNYVYLKIVNTDVYKNRLTDTVNSFNHTKGILAYTGYTSKFTWLVQNGSQWDTLVRTSGDVGSGYYWANRQQLGGAGTYTVACDAKIFGKCYKRTIFPIVVKPRPGSGTASNAMTLATCAGGVIKDARDGEFYGTTRIGNQCWMAENLRYKGDADWAELVRFRTDDAQGSLWGGYYCLNCSATSTATIRENACPAGWHLPTNAESNEMRVYLEALAGTTEEARYIRSGNGWSVYSNINGATNQSIVNIVDKGFGWGATGFFDNSKVFQDNSYGYFITWDGYYNQLAPTNNEYYYATAGLSYYYMPIRCIKN